MKTTSWAEQLELACKYVGDPVESLVVRLFATDDFNGKYFDYMWKENALEREYYIGESSYGLTGRYLDFYAWSTNYVYVKGESVCTVHDVDYYVRVIPKEPVDINPDFPMYFKLPETDTTPLT